jgi:hypothetical protein
MSLKKKRNLLVQLLQIKFGVTHFDFKFDNQILGILVLGKCQDLALDLNVKAKNCYKYKINSQTGCCVSIINYSVIVVFIFNLSV